MIAYLLKSATCLALLLAFYYLVLEREKMHNFNRFYLIGSIFFSFLAPLYIIYVDATPIIIENVSAGNITYDIENISSEIIIENPIDYKSILVTIYFIISTILFIRLCKNLFNIIHKTRKNTAIPFEKAILILVNDKILPHTFWNYIFINKNDYENKKVEKELFTHELTHVTQKHTLDILLLELLQAIFWVNPFFILLKKAVQLNHEFLADESVIHQHKNTIQYQHLLVNKAAWKNEYYLASNLNYSLTKKRLKMMTTQSSHTKILLKKLAVIPLLAGFVYLFAERVEAQEVQEIVENPIETIEEQLNSKEGYPIKTGFIEIKNNKYFYVDVNKSIKYYNKNGILSDKNGKTLSNKKANASEILPDNYITKTYLNNKVFCEFLDDKPSEKAKWQKLSDVDTIQIIEVIEEKKPKEIEIKEQKKKYNSPSSNGSQQSFNDIKLADVKKLYAKINSTSNVYNRKNKYYEELRLEKPHFVKSTKERQKQLEKLFSELGSLYFKLSKENKEKAKRPIHPYDPYLKLRKNNKVFYKLRKELTEEDKLLIPPPPPVPNASEEEILRAKKAYEAWKKRTGNDFAPLPPPNNHLDQVIEMAKKGAEFYYEKEPINSDKAIALLKENKSLTIHSESTNNSNYKVWISNTSLKNKPSEKGTISIHNSTNKVVKTKFSIILEKDQEQIKMICKKGCEWKELNFKLNLKTPQIVNKYGLNEVNQRNKDDSFYLVLLQDKGTFDMKSTKNTKWKGVSGSSNEKMKLLINENKVKSIIK
ncbi:M56 family metallopeptidase [Polaribacter sp. Asnod6-C07]|uniref:M56 family metallopeptidase n=1 Tax=Polaribacter sp. Asnod6-C07 TaxID=3160582 RepID=UPI0038706B23